MAPAPKDEGLKKLEFLSLVSKVCTELETHIGFGEEILAEFKSCYLIWVYVVSSIRSVFLIWVFLVLWFRSFFLDQILYFWRYEEKGEREPLRGLWPLS
jgi:hypothetical protein